ncbi:transcription-repair coupling factor [Maioricimonas sp. JC845]|uniref:transcription-repair coupling factor n=1 Tax=Maioricimonas sp. JC845 TaxID=3232138 RepID=UPI003458BE60
MAQAARESEIRSLVDLPGRICRHPGFRDVLSALGRGESATVDGAWGSCSALVAAGLAGSSPATLLVVCPRISDVDAMASDLASYLEEEPLILPAWESLPSEHTLSDEVFGQRLRVLGQLEGASPPRVVVTSFPALLQPVPARSTRQSSQRRLSVGETLDLDELLRWLVDRGFERVPVIERPGEFSVHGGIIDIYTADAADPLRVELFGDEVDSLRRFDVETQRKTESLKESVLTAVAPVALGDAAEPADAEVASAASEAEHFADCLPEGSWILLQDLADMQEEGRSYLRRLDDARGLYTVESALERVTAWPTVSVTALGLASFEASCHLQVESIERFTGPKSEVLSELAGIVGRDETVLIACHNEGERERLAELLAQSGVGLEGRAQLCVGTVTRGFRLVRDRLIVIGDNELFNRTDVRRVRRRRRPETRAIDTFLDLSEGDLVVHIAHGIARYRGMEVLESEGRKEEHLTLEFRDGVRVFVPVSLIHLVQKYVGAAKSAPRLSKLGGTLWSRQKKKVSDAISDMASDMLRLQAARESKPGIACPPDSHWIQEFEASFPYVETDDQLTAIEESKQDLERPRPMDRLICGDVGFGKTEVAMRAAFKMIDSGRQVAVLVPTTVLAEQHFRTFTDRMAEFPITIELLSRFRTKSEQRKVVASLEEGRVDLVIGTHRLVQPDVKFKDLGLLIIDEEQRFGVDAKEMLKRLRLAVDVMTLSATPIPRTLHMSLLGIRDISNLTTPPQDRVSIETRICRWDGDLIRRAVVRELNRGGQVYFVHNRVYNIRSIADRLRSIVPEAEIGIVHGQMKENELEQNMLAFVSGRTDILVATTIIESGLDIPNANTIFIHEADRYGLADLHQLRGRVGRYKHRAYCYLILDERRPLTGIAAKRLKAIEEYSELGSGFRIAMRDLEIRGAGNILGTEQSGHIATVGYELYCQLLENAVRQLKGEAPRENPYVNVDLPIQAYLPDEYVGTGRAKIDVYRKLAAAGTAAELAEVEEELRDRFGPLPPPAGQLLSLKELQLLAFAWRLETIRLEAGYAVFGYRNSELVKELASKLRPDLRVVDRRNAYLVLPRDELTGAALLEHLKSVLR